MLIKCKKLGEYYNKTDLKYIINKELTTRVHLIGKNVVIFYRKEDDALVVAVVVGNVPIGTLIRLILTCVIHNS